MRAQETQVLRPARLHADRPHLQARPPGPKSSVHLEQCGTSPSSGARPSKCVREVSHRQRATQMCVRWRTSTRVRGMGGGHLTPSSWEVPPAPHQPPGDTLQLPLGSQRPYFTVAWGWGSDRQQVTQPQLETVTTVGSFLFPLHCSAGRGT